MKTMKQQATQKNRHLDEDKHKMGGGGVMTMMKCVCVHA